MKIKIEWADGETNTLKVGKRLGHAIADGLAMARKHSHVVAEEFGQWFHIVYPNPSEGIANPAWEPLNDVEKALLKI